MYNTSQKWKNNIYTNVQCAMNIYVDDVLVNPDYIFDFRKGGNIFDEELVLGSTPAQYVEMQLYKGVIPNNPKTVRVEYGILIDSGLSVAEINSMLVGTLNGIQIQSIASNNTSFEMIPIGTYNIDDYTDNDDGTITIKAVDNMIKFEFNYDGSELINAKGGSAKLSEVAQDICNKAGVRLGSSTFLNSNKVIAVYDNTVSAREYIGYIAESAGCFAFIGRDGKLYFREIYQDTAEVSINLFADFKWSEEYKISKVSYEDGIRSFKFGDDSRNTLWINQENMFIVDEEQVENIYNSVKNMTINSFEGRTIIDPAIDIGDKLIIDGKSIVYQGEMTLEGRFIADIKSKIQIKQKEDTTTRRESQKVINRRVQSNIDQINGTITLLSEETTENTHNIAQLEITSQSIVSDVGSLKINLENNYYTRTQINSQINQKADEITMQVSRTYATKSDISDFVTESEMNSAIRVSAEGIRTEVNKKVNSSDFGTLIEQNYSHVRIAWNNISRYIQFENAQLNIYDSSNYKLLSLNNTGLNLYVSGTKIGNMALNNISGQSYIKGLNFELEMPGYYMSWSRKTSSSSNYMMALTYSRANGAYAEDGLHLGVPLYARGQPIYFDTNKYVRTVGYSNAGAIRVTSGSFYIERNNGSSILKFNWDGRLEVHSEMTMYANLQLNGYSVWLDGNTIHVSSDKRLKKNIKPINVSALDKISQLKVKEFDWKANNEHVNAGFIAQELQEIFPDLVKENPTKKEMDGKEINFLAISYEGLIPYLVKSVQELKSIIDKEKENGK